MMLAQLCDEPCGARDAERPFGSTPAHRWRSEVAT
jgi:hypothetical protein